MSLVSIKELETVHEIGTTRALALGGKLRKLRKLGSVLEKV